MIGTKIILVGMPGAGKSTFGKHLAAALDYQFVDLDHAIEALSGKTIPDLFSISENLFRQKETETLEHVISEKQSSVIASGGGTPCFNDNMKLILEQSISIFLDPPMSVLISRTEKEAHRPLLQGKNVKDRLEELYKKRKAFYDKANIKLTTEELDPHKVVNLISIIKS